MPVLYSNSKKQLVNDKNSRDIGEKIKGNELVQL